jgi:hypothetical protein
MKNKIVLTWIFLCAHLVLLAQPCLPAGISFSRQGEIDSFQINFPGCTSIEGFVRINGSGITNLFGLHLISSIEESLLILENNNLTSLEGLESLIHVGGNVSISGNNVLTSLTGLSQLQTIGTALTIEDNPLLTNIGMISLTHIQAV